jgi:RNA polymerase-interacting CarD/CdnL/TRCF family regulator
MVRSLMTASEARKLLDQIKNWDGTAKDQWKARAEGHQAAIDGGDPFEYAKILKELSRMEADGTLRPRDKANLDQSMELLTEELSRALEKTPAQAHQLIRKVISGG